MLFIFYIGIYLLFAFKLILWVELSLSVRRRTVPRKSPFGLITRFSNTKIELYFFANNDWIFCSRGEDSSFLSVVDVVDFVDVVVDISLLLALNFKLST